MTADLALAADPGFLERSADPAEFVIQACERAKVWLAEALEHGDIDQIVEVKSQAEAVRVYTMQKQLGKDAQLSAAEIVRRAERGIGVAIRKGQAAGKIRKHGEHAGNQYTNGSVPDANASISPKSYIRSGGEMHETYAMTDGISDSDFDEVIAEAKAEENLSRANLIRKIRTPRAGQSGRDENIPDRDDYTAAAAGRRRELIRKYAESGYSSRQMEGMLGTLAESIRQIARDIGVEIGADAIVGKTRIHDSNRIVRETVHALEGLAMGVQLVEPDDLDRDQVEYWAASLTQSVRTLNRLIKTMKEAAQ